MKYASVCSGVEAATLAWMPLGWEAAWFSEIEPFPCAVLKERFPNVPNLGDMTKIKVENMENGDQKFTGGDGTTCLVPRGVDLLVGGTPCQSFSVAGKREGLDGASGLAKSFVELLGSMRPRWFVWENVPGCLSSINKRTGVYDFNFLLAAFAERGYSCGWRILDAQYVRVDGYPRAVPQRRRRVFVVGHSSADWRYPASVLFEPDSLFRDTPPRRVKGKGVARDAAGGAGETGRLWDDSGVNPTLNQCNAGSGIIGASNQELFSQNANGLVMTEVGKGRLQCVIEPREDSVECLDIRHVDVHDTDLAPTLIATDYKGGKYICFQQNSRDEVRIISQDGTVAGALTASPGAKQQNYLCYENHAQDSRVKDAGEVSPQLNAQAGTGGNNLPLVKEPDVIGFIKNDAGGVQQGFWKNVFPTLRAAITPAITWNECFHLSFCDANGTRKDRKNGGLYVTKAETSQTAKDVHAVAYDECVPLDLRNATRDPEKHDAQNRHGVGVGEDGAPMNTVTAASVPGVGWQATVRKLLPIECERLMGFPDNHTRIPWRGKQEEECPDAPRYKACGNSMCVNVMRWIGMRIEIAERKNNA